MSRAFDYCAKLVLSEEGGLVDHPRDPGGRTNLGVTAETLEQARKVLSDLPASVDQLTAKQALSVYRVLYWDRIRGNELPLPLALITFDAAINQGVADATRFLQQGVGAGVDGNIGPKTLLAAHQQPVKVALAEIAARRMHDYMLLDRLDDTFGLGWSRRLVRIILAAEQAFGVTL